MAGRALPFGEKGKLLAGVLCLHLLYAGFHIVSRVALDMGMGKVVFMVYRNVTALTLLLPFAYFLEKNDRPPMSFSTAVNFLAVSVVLTTAQALYILGVYYLSPTFVTAIANCSPAFTFALAAALRLLEALEGLAGLQALSNHQRIDLFFRSLMVRIEQVSITTTHGVAKLVGMLAGIGGATIITFYKGAPLLHGGQSAGNDIRFLGSTTPTLLPSAMTSVVRNWKLGCILIVSHCFSWSVLMVLQVPLLKKYPARLSVSAIMSFLGLLLFLVIAAFTERDVDNWKIHSAGELLTTLYSGIFASGVAFTLQIWCIGRGGPLFVAVFEPLQTVAVAVMATCILGDQLYLGGIIGAATIVVGLYLVIWGKSKETQPAANEEESHLAKPLIVEEDDRQRLIGGALA